MGELGRAGTQGGLHTTSAARVVRKNSVLLTQASASTRGAVRRVSLWHAQSRNLRGDAETSELKARRHSLEDPERQAPAPCARGLDCSDPSTISVRLADEIGRASCRERV